MPNKLTNLVITKVALVDEGSCSDAHIQFFKRKEEGGNKMDFETLKKSLTPEQVAVLEAEIEKAKATLPEGAMSKEDAAKLAADKQAATEAQAAAEGEVAKLKEQLANPGQKSDEDILKNAKLDTAVRAVVESTIAKAKAAEQAVLAMTEKAQNSEFLAKAKTLSCIPEAETKVLALMKSIKDVEGANDALMSILSATNELISKGTAFTEIGTGGGGTTGVDSGAELAWQAIEKKAQGLVAKGSMSKEKAIQFICDTEPAMYNAYLNALRNE